MVVNAASESVMVVDECSVATGSDKQRADIQKSGSIHVVLALHVNLLFTCFNLV